MSFQQGLSGLNAASKNLEVIGNNVANASTVGFKQSRAQFADVYATSLTGKWRLTNRNWYKISYCCAAIYARQYF